MIVCDSQKEQALFVLAPFLLCTHCCYYLQPTAFIYAIHDGRWIDWDET